MDKETKVVENKERRIREWLNTGIAFAILVVMILGYVTIKEIPPRLDKLSDTTNKTININEPLTITGDYIQVWYFNSSSNETIKIT